MRSKRWFRAFLLKKMQSALTECNVRWSYRLPSLHVFSYFLLPGSLLCRHTECLDIGWCNYHSIQGPWLGLHERNISSWNSGWTNRYVFHSYSMHKGKKTRFYFYVNADFSFLNLNWTLFCRNNFPFYKSRILYCNLIYCDTKTVYIFGGVIESSSMLTWHEIRSRKIEKY